MVRIKTRKGTVQSPADVHETFHENPSTDSKVLRKYDTDCGTIKRSLLVKQVQYVKTHLFYIYYIYIAHNPTALLILIYQHIMSIRASINEKGTTNRNRCPFG
jgi:hypothetical protein